MAAIALKPEEQELLREEVAAFAAAAPDDASRARLGVLAADVERGELAEEQLAAAGQVLEIGLQTGRIRKLHRASGEQALLRLFGKTPIGAALTQAIGTVNTALQTLEGRTIESARVLSRVPGTFLLAIDTDACEITLKFTPDGVSVESVALGV